MKQEPIESKANELYKMLCYRSIIQVQSSIMYIIYYDSQRCAKMRRRCEEDTISQHCSIF